MVELKYIGTHQPKGMIVEIEEKNIKRYLDSGNYEILSKSDTLININKIVPKKETPNKSWKEIEIYDWIKKNKISIDYVPSRDRKDDVLKKLKEGGYLNDNGK